MAEGTKEKTAIHAECPIDFQKRQIRLLRILPGAWDEPLHCGFEVVSLDDDVSYVTLSYVWGHEPADCEVFFGNKTRTIKPNLYSALRRIRAHSGREQQLLWCDALCINQDSINERNHQVGLMGLIYSKSKEVFIWMGEMESSWVYWQRPQIERNLGRCYDFTSISDEDAGAAPSQQRFKYRRGTGGDTVYTLIDDLHSFPQSEVLLQMACLLHCLAYSHELADAFRLWGQSMGQNHKEHMWKTLYNLQTHEWFRRLWVVQEMVLAPQCLILMGPVILPYETIIEAHGKFEKHIKRYRRALTQAGSTRILGGPREDLLRRGIESFVDMAGFRTRLKQMDRSLNIFEMRSILYCRSASVGLDQIYALLGLNLKDTGRITPDYGVQSNDLYITVTKNYIEDKCSLMPLCFSGALTGITRAALPSWTVDWSTWTAEASGYDYRAWTKLHSIFRASKTTRWSSNRHEFDGNNLAVDAFPLDKVVTIAPYMIQRHNYATRLDSREASFRGDVSYFYFPPKDQRYSIPGTDLDLPGLSWEEVWVKTMCAGSFWSSASGITRTPLRLTVKQIRSATAALGKTKLSYYDPWHAERTRHTEIIQDEATFSRVKQSIDYTLNSVTWTQKLFTTKGDLLGLGPKNIETKDELFIVAGCNFPLVLRNAGNKSDAIQRYRVIGACYIEGFMDGVKMDDSSHTQRIHII